MVEDRVPRRDLSTAVRANCVFDTRGVKVAAGRPVRRRTLGWYVQGQNTHSQPQSSGAV